MVTLHFLDHTINKGNHDDKVIIGYGNVSEEEIQEGVQRLTSVLGRNKRAKA